MMKINRQYKRSIKSDLSFYVTVSLLTCLIGVIIIAASSTGKTMNNALVGTIERNHTEDAQFSVMLPIDEEEEKEIEKKFSVILEKMQYFDYKTKNYTLRLLSESQEINTYEITEGNPPSSEHDLLISERFAEEHQISIGDKIEIEGETFNVSGYMLRPDYLYMLKEVNDTYPNYDSFGAAVATKEALDSIEGNRTYYSVIYRTEDDPSEMKKYINDKNSIISFISRSSNSRIATPASEGDSLLTIAMGVSPVIFIVVVLLVSLILGRKLKKEQKQIGTLTALGYRKNELIGHYALYSLIPAIIGGILGAAAGCLSAVPLSDYYLSFYEYIPHNLAIAPVAIAISVAAPIILYLLTAIFTVRKTLKKKPVEMLRSIESDNNGNSEILRNSKMKFSTKYKLRSILRHKSRTFIVIIGVTVSTLCVLIGWSIKDAVDELVSTSVQKMPYEYAYFMLTTDNEIPEEAEGVLMKQFEKEGSTAAFQIWGYDKDSKYISLTTKSGKNTEYGKNYMTFAIAEDYGISAGDTLIFRDIITAEEHSIVIDDIIDDNTNSVVYVNRKTASDLIGISEEESNVILSNKPIDDKLDSDNVISVVSKQDVKSSIESVVDMYYVVCYAVTVLGFVIGVLAMYLITNMIIEENRINISMLKILGYRKKEISRMILHVNAYLVPVGFLLGIPLTLLTCKVGFASSVESIGMYFPIALKARSYMITFVIVLISYFVSVFLAGKKVEKADMVEALKRNNE